MQRAPFRNLSLGLFFILFVSCANHYFSLQLDAENANLAWSPDGKVLAIVSGDGTVHLWDSTQRSMSLAIRSQETVSSVSWSPDGGYLASNSWSDAGLIHVWSTQLDDMTEVRSIPVTNARILNWSPRGSMISVGTRDGMVLVWDMEVDDVRVLESPSVDVLNIVWAPDGRSLAAGFSDGSIYIWDADNSQLVNHLSFSADDYIADLAWSPDGATLASASCYTGPSLPENCVLVLWNPSTSEYIQAMRGGVYDVSSIAWSPHGRWIASGMMNGDVVLYNPNAGQRVQTLRTPIGMTIVSWSPDSRHLAAGSEDGSVLIWDID
jgi:Tol biopolymer transport system component